MRNWGVSGSRYANTDLLKRNGRVKLGNFSSCCIKVAEDKFSERVNIAENIDSRLTSIL